MARPANPIKHKKCNPEKSACKYSASVGIFPNNFNDGRKWTRILHPHIHCAPPPQCVYAMYYDVIMEKRYKLSKITWNIENMCEIINYFHIPFCRFMELIFFSPALRLCFIFALIYVLSLSPSRTLYFLHFPDWTPINPFRILSVTACEVIWAARTPGRLMIRFQAQANTRSACEDNDNWNVLPLRVWFEIPAGVAFGPCYI